MFKNMFSLSFLSKLAGAGLIILLFILIKWPLFTTIRAQVYDVTGEWDITIRITDPISITALAEADWQQSGSGNITGIVTNLETGETVNVTGNVSGNQIWINNFNYTVEYQGSEYETVTNFTGTISEDSNGITGTVEGQVISPFTIDFEGNFTGERIGGSGGIMGDINGNGIVNIGDLIELIAVYSTGNQPADLNGSGRVDIFDLGILIVNYGRQ